MTVVALVSIVGWLLEKQTRGSCTLRKESESEGEGRKKWQINFGKCLQLKFNCCTSLLLVTVFGSIQCNNVYLLWQREPAHKEITLQLEHSKKID